MSSDQRFLEGRIAVVTGGGRGIGRSVALALGRAGATVIPAGRTSADLAAVAEQARSDGGTAMPVACDVSSEKDVRALFERIDAEFGAIHILVNNAGVAVFGPVEEATVDDWDTVMNVNARGAFLCSREAFRRMRECGGGRIVNIGSVVSLKGYARQGVYTASKHALLGLTKVLAEEGREHDIVVQAVCPGGVDTELVGRARPDLDTSVLMTPEEIAESVLFLLAQQGNAVVDMLHVRRRASSPFST